MTPTNPEKQPQIQDFIFYRELSEVYLLLDHISGRWDKSFYTDKADSSNNNMDSPGPSWLLTICEIGWPPHSRSSLDQARQAAALLRAKDMLNAAAKPANGATIAFTLMVMGEDTPEERTWTSRWIPKIKIIKPPPPPAPPDSEPVREEPRPAPDFGIGIVGEAHAAVHPAPGAGPAGEGGAGGAGSGGEGGNGNGAGGGPDDPMPANPPPNRISLARIAFPGLVGQAALFTRRIRSILWLLALWLVFTCLLSWDVAAGNVILGHLDTVHAQRKEIEKKISDAESKAASRTAREAARAESASGGSDSRATVVPAIRPAGGAAGAAGTVGATPPLVIHYCDQSLMLPALSGTGGAKIQQFHDVDELHLCDARDANEQEHASSSRNLTNWLGMWRGMYHVVSGAKWSKTRKNPEPQPSEQKEACDEETGRIVALLLGGSVLPLCYGILGAGAAVVRDLWAKMRESLLSPRDYTLALGQLALGATIGACISLFITPAGAAQAEGALIGGWGLSASALSFVAGFGVESVFVALESLVRRVFNTPDPSKRTQ